MIAIPSQPWRLSQPVPQPRLGLVDAPEVKPFWQVYEPTTLAEVLGQAKAVELMSGFVRQPCPRPVLLHGPTGCGKTCSAKAMAHDLGADPFWGIKQVASGRLDLEKCDEIMREMRLVPMASAWRVIIIDEADTMTLRAKQILLSWLEEIGSHTVLILTTNNPDAFTRRERSRFLEIEFVDSGDDALAGAQALADSIWRAETGGEDGPDLADLPNAVIDGKVSFRLICNALEALIRYGAPLQPAKPHRPDTFTLPPAPKAAVAAPRVPASNPAVIPSPSVGTSPAQWWDALTLSQRCEARGHFLNRNNLASLRRFKRADFFEC